MKKLIQSISLLLISTAVLSAQPNWNPVIYTNSTTLYAKVTINGLPAQTGDKVAAFVNGECRGVSDVVTNANEGYVTLLIQGESAEENASFKIWSESNDVVYFVNKFVWTNPGNTIGTPPDYFLIEGNGPDWKPVIYTNSTTLYGIVTINNVSAQPGDVVGAFVNGECRGREKVIMNNDTAYVTMLIQGEAVENVSFLIWQASSVKALLVPKHISSDPGGTISLININAVNGLVAFYQFNNNLIDETKNGFDLLGGGLTFVKDRFNTPNTSVAFDGSTSQAEVSNSSSLDFRKNGFTISTWVKYSSNGNAVIFGKHVHGYYNGYFLAAVNNRLQFYVSGIPITASEYSNDNQWHLVTGVYDGMNATLYVDGVQEATQQIPYTDFSPNPVRLGYMQTPGYPERYNGLIDDARLYNVPLSQTDVSNLFTENNWTAQEISIINPTGGQRLKANSFYTIDWTATQFIDSVIIEFTTNNGLTMEVIAPSLPGNSEGFYWHVPKINTTQAKIRVRHLSSGVSGVTAVPFIIDPPKITVTSPNGGETFVFGEIDTVKWVSENLDDVYLEYTIDNGASWMEMEDYTIPAADGKFLWRIPFVSSSNCKVRISDGADSVSFADVSDNVFSIVLPMVKLNKPNGGENFIVGKSDTIKWISSNVANVKLEYTTDNGSSWISILTSTPASVGSFVWTIPNTPSTNCKVKISNADNSFFADTSDNIFSIKNPVVTLLSPNGGEQWRRGSSQKISWTSSDVAKVKIQYSTNDGTTWIVVADSALASTGSFDWTIPSPVTNQAKVRITDYKDVTVSSQSAAPFTIYFPTVTLTAPNGGELWQIGSQKNISWTSTYLTKVKLEYTTDGTIWKLIAEQLDANLNNYLWTIPNDPSAIAKVRITDATDNLVKYTCEGTFTIYQQKLTLTSPLGGERYRELTTQNVTWTSEYVDTIKIELSEDNGVSWAVINGAVPAKLGSYNYIASTWITKQAKIRISDSKNAALQSTSNTFEFFKPIITVSSPNGNEQWIVGTTQKIIWTSSDVANVKIEYTTDNIIWNTIASSVTSAVGSYDWLIPNTPSVNCKVKISDASDNFYSDLSNNVFSIILPKVTVTSPNGGEQWIVGATQNITWTSSNVANVKLEYTTNNGTNWNSVLTSTPASAGSFVWTIPNTPSANCKIRISDASNIAVPDLSDNVFSIILPQISVLKPNGGENFIVGKTDTIKWSSANVVNVKLEYSTDNGSNWISILASTPAAAGSFVWTIPNTPSANCKIRISDASNIAVPDLSDNVFSIILPKVTVTAPNGGEQWIVGATQNITWTSSNVANVKLEYTTNNGTNWNSVLTSTPASAGSFVWTIPNTPSTNCKVRISDVTNSSFADASDNVFSIILPKVTVLRPNGGEVFTVITGDTIKWVSTNITTVKIEFSSDNGLNWETLTNSWAADLESFFWPIEQNQPLSNNCRIKISDASNPAISDMSDQTFSIVGFPSLILTSPGATEKWLANTNHQITWISANLDTIKIEFSSNSGSSWKVIAENIVAENGTYTWSTAESPTTQAVIRISPRNNEFPWSASGNFTIYKEALTVISPNGGERLKAKTFVPITWNISEIVNPKTLKNKSGEELNTASAPIQNVKIEFTSDNGLNWNSIVNSVGASLKSYNWQVPVIESKDCKIKITDVDDATHADTSDAVFEIYNPQLLVTAPNGGEILVAGKTDTIKWTSSNIANIKLEFTSDNGSNWNSIITSTPASSGNYVWTIPSTSSKNCKVRISDVLNPEMTDISDGVFTIITPTITLSSPNGGEKWLTQTEHQISWTSADLDSIRIDFSFDNGTTWNVIAPKVFAWDAIYNWNVESLPSSQALIRVSKYDDLSVQDVSDNTFTIYKEALAVISPNGGERLRAKTIVPVTWNISDIINPKTRNHSSGEGQTVASAPIQNVKIEFSSDNGKSWNSIVNSVSAALKSYNWEISTVESKECRIRIVDVDDASHADTSDGVFEIYTPKLIVTSPNGGEKWRAATNNRIEWISTEVTKVKIEYSTNEGFAWKTISDSIEAASGRIDWTIPSERTTKARVRVTDITLASTSDTSDNAFTIVVPEITLTSPIGGETWKTNTVQQIKWNSLDVELVSVEYSSDGGTSWLPIKDSVLASTGVYNWTIPRTPTEQAKVRVSDVNYKEIASTSSLFTIIKPLVLLSPKGGEKWFSGSVQQIKWNYISVDSIKLEFSLNNGVSWQTIANSLPASLLTYDWNIPQNIASNQCKVKITDRNNFLTADSTVEVFTIMTPTLTVLTPNGEENFKGGTTYEITWKNENSDSLVIDYSIDNGATWTSIAKSTNAKAEKFTWVIPKVTSTQCRIRVIDKFYTTVGDTSDKAFSIYTPMITVITPKGGETWFVGETKQIKWKSSFVESVKIVLTTDDGNSWRTLTNSFAASDSIFSLFIEKTPSLDCRIKISAVEDSSVIDSSRSNFAIVVLPPTIYVSILQNPVLTQYCNVVLITDSLLSALPTTTVWRAGENEIPVYEMKPIPNSANAYECSIKFDTTAIYNIALHVISKMGIEKDTLRQFAVGVALPTLFAKVTSKNAGLTLTINPGVVEEKTFFSIEEENVNKEIVYNLQPAKTFKKAIGVELSFANETYQEVYKLSLFVFDNGEWKPVQSKVNKKNKTVTASLTTLGKVKLGIDANKKEELDLPQTFALIQNYPNPFNPSTIIAFHLPEDCDITVEIYNMLGAKITTLRSGFTAAGRYSVTWNGMNDAKVQVPSGIYLYRLKTNKFDQVRKMILLK